MTEFKVGDSVKRVTGAFNGTVTGGVYTVREVDGDGIRLHGYSSLYDEKCFVVLEESDPSNLVSVIQHARECQGQIEELQKVLDKHVATLHSYGVKLI